MPAKPRHGSKSASRAPVPVVHLDNIADRRALQPESQNRIALSVASLSPPRCSSLAQGDFPYMRGLRIILNEDWDLKPPLLATNAGLDFNTLVTYWLSRALRVVFCPY